MMHRVWAGAGRANAARKSLRAGGPCRQVNAKMPPVHLPVDFACAGAMPMSSAAAKCGGMWAGAWWGQTRKGHAPHSGIWP